jgi:hypothetical protein
MRDRSMTRRCVVFNCTSSGSRPAATNGLTQTVRYASSWRTACSPKWSPRTGERPTSPIARKSLTAKGIQTSLWGSWLIRLPGGGVIRDAGRVEQVKGDGRDRRRKRAPPDRRTGHRRGLLLRGIHLAPVLTSPGAVLIPPVGAAQPEVRGARPPVGLPRSRMGSVD